MTIFIYVRTTFIESSFTVFLNVMKLEIIASFMKWCIVAFLFSSLYSCSDSQKTKKVNDNTENKITKPTGLVYTILKKGNGPAAKEGQEVLIHETTKYLNDSLLFSSREMPNPIKVLLGGHQTIEGVDEGLRGMQAGEIRKLIIPPSLSKRAGNPTFPHPDSTLVYEIELVKILSTK